MTSVAEAYRPDPPSPTGADFASFRFHWAKRGSSSDHMIILSVRRRSWRELDSWLFRWWTLLSSVQYIFEMRVSCAVSLRPVTREKEHCSMELNKLPYD